MKALFSIYKRELVSYFITPIAYVFIVIFLFMTGIFTFYLGAFYESNQADLEPFFRFHPWLYLFLIPAISMRLWADEKKSGTIELLMTLPISVKDIVVGKYLAAWTFTALALVLTFPLWVTVNYLGEPDNMVIFTSYVGSFVMAGGFIAISSCISAFTKSQVIAFVISVVVCFMFIFSGFPMVLDIFKAWAPQVIVDAVASFSFLSHFTSIKKGVVEFRDVIYFVALIIFWLYANIVIVEMKKAS